MIEKRENEGVEIDINEIVKNININGYYVLKNYYNNEFCEKVINDINILLEAPSVGNIGEGGDIRITNFEKYSLDGAYKFLNNNLFLEIGKRVLNGKKPDQKKRCQLGLLKYNPSKSNQSSGGGWHVDNHNPQFKALLYLTKVNINNGPFAIISPPITSKNYKPISNERNTRFDDSIEDKYKDNIHYITGDPGDVILVNTQYVHRGAVIQDGERISLTNYYYD